MSKEKLWDKIRGFIGHLAWMTFLWSIQMTKDEYLDTVIAEHNANHVRKNTQSPTT